MNNVLNQEIYLIHMNQNVLGGVGAKRKTLPLTEESSCVVMDKFVGAKGNTYTVLGCRIIDVIDIFVNCNWVDTRWQ